MSTLQSLTNRVKFLEQKHRELDKEIYTLFNEYHDHYTLTPLKLKKLNLKRKIEQLKEEIEVIDHG